MHFNPTKTAFYLTGITKSTTGISTAGAWQPTLMVEPGHVGTSYNFYINKFASSLLVGGFEQKPLALVPNPSHGVFSLQGDWQGSSNTLMLKMYDNLGRAIITQPLTSITQEITVPNLSKGVYFAQLFNENQKVQTFKLVVE